MAALDNILTEKSSSSAMHKALVSASMPTDHERLEYLEKDLIQFKGEVDLRFSDMLAKIDKKLWFIIGMSAALGAEKLLSLAGVLH